MLHSWLRVPHLSKQQQPMASAAPLLLALLPSLIFSTCMHGTSVSCTIGTLPVSTPIHLSWLGRQAR